MDGGSVGRINNREKPSVKSEFRVVIWIIPLCYVAGAVVSGIIFPRIENRVFPTLVSDIAAPAAMAIYSAIASGMLALTGVVFSLAFVMIQFSATAYSPPSSSLDFSRPFPIARGRRLHPYFSLRNCSARMGWPRYCR